LRWNRKERRKVEGRLNSTDPGLEIVNPHAAGIDVGDESHDVAVPPGRDAQPVREFGSWTAALEEMAQWWKSWGVKTVGMQSTGVYGIALFSAGVGDPRGAYRVAAAGSAHQGRGALHPAYAEGADHDEPAIARSS
jgi:hypothetical protein